MRDLLYLPRRLTLKSDPGISFSKLGFPDWSLDKILDFAVENGYDGVEIRGLQRHLNLPNSPEFSSKENILLTVKRLKDKNIKIVDLGASALVHQADSATRKEFWMKQRVLFNWQNNYTALA